MSDITIKREVDGFRWVPTRVGDTLQELCARELGDASVWADVAAFNGLRPPYITDNPRLAGPGVILSGEQIRLPAPVRFVAADTDPNAVFLVDLSLAHGRLSFAADGDLTLVEGRDNLRQALKHRIVTPRGELVMHADYGSLVARILGAAAGPTARLLAAQYARATVAADSRVASISSATADVAGDAVTVQIAAVTIAGVVVNAEATV